MRLEPAAPRPAHAYLPHAHDSRAASALRRRGPSARRTARARRPRVPCARNQPQMLAQSRIRKSMPFWLPTRSTICGRSMITRRGPAARMLYAERSPWTIPACTIVARASRSWSKYDCQQRRLRPRLGQPRGGLTVVGDPLHEDLGPVDLHGVGDRQAEVPQPHERAPLGDRPLAGRDLAAEGALPLEGALVARPLHRAALGVGGRAVEGAVLRSSGSAWRPSPRRGRARAGRPARAGRRRPPCRS